MAQAYFIDCVISSSPHCKKFCVMLTLLYMEEGGVLPLLVHFYNFQTKQLLPWFSLKMYYAHFIIFVCK